MKRNREEEKENSSKKFASSSTQNKWKNIDKYLWCKVFNYFPIHVLFSVYSRVHPEWNKWIKTCPLLWKEKETTGLLLPYTDKMCVSTIFEHCNLLSVLSLQNVCLSLMADALEYLPTFINLKQLEFVQYSWDKYDILLLSQCKQLRILKLKGNLNPLLIQDSLHPLCTLSYLEELELNNTYQNLSLLDSFLQSLISNTSTSCLKKLKISCFSLHVSTLLESIQSCTTLETLHMDTMAIASFISSSSFIKNKSNTNLKELIFTKEYVSTSTSLPYEKKDNMEWLRHLLEHSLQLKYLKVELFEKDLSTLIYLHQLKELETLIWTGELNTWGFGIFSSIELSKLKHLHLKLSYNQILTHYLETCLKTLFHSLSTLTIEVYNLTEVFIPTSSCSSSSSNINLIQVKIINSLLILTPCLQKLHLIWSSLLLDKKKEKIDSSSLLNVPSSCIQITEQKSITCPTQDIYFCSKF